MAEMRVDNARIELQRERMEQLIREGKCFFCEVFRDSQMSDTEPRPDWYRSLQHIGKDWFAMKSDFAYVGSVHHYLIASRKHVTNLKDMSSQAFYEFLGVVDFLANIIGVGGYSLVLRSGDMAYTCGTLDHLHWHFIVGEKKVGTEKNKVEDLIAVYVGYKKKL